MVTIPLYPKEVDEIMTQQKRDRNDSEVQGTHWEGCEQAHHDCALAKVESLSDQVEDLTRHLESSRHAHASTALAHAEAEAQVAELKHDISRQMAIATEHVNRAEAAEAQVAGLRRELDEVQKECDGMRAIGLVDWKGRAEAAEAQVAELRKDAERWRKLMSLSDADEAAVIFPGPIDANKTVTELIDAAKESGDAR
jgi:chromosome segregation ATPase